MLLSLSVAIATMGLVRNSGAVVIAAMLIAPLMTPILGIAASMMVGRNQRVLKLLGAVILAALFSIALAWLIVFLAEVPKSMVTPEQILARTDPGTEDLIIALAAGSAGAYVQINRTEVSLLPGAAIGVSLVPPLSAAGVLLYFGDHSNAYEAVLLFATNLAAIILSACAVYMAFGARSFVLKKGRRRAHFTVSFFATLLVLALILAQLVTATYNRYFETRLEANLAREIEEWAGDVSVEIVRVDVRLSSGTADIWLVFDLPFEAGVQIASVVELLPAALRNDRIIDRMREVLGPEYKVALRYQPRFAGLIFLDTEQVIDAPRAIHSSNQ